MSLARQEDAQSAGFDFTLHMRRLCEDMTDRLGELRHIDLARVGIGFCQARKNTRHGLYATLTPMRFANGRAHTIRRGRKWGMQRLQGDSGREMLYVLTFYLPRFLDLSFDEKLSTILHELWHISPEFNGDVRRYAGRCYAHSASGDHERQAVTLAKRWLALKPPRPLYEFLQSSFRQIHQRHGGIYGRQIPAPKLFRID